MCFPEASSSWPAHTNQADTAPKKLGCQAPCKDQAPLGQEAHRTYFSRGSHPDTPRGRAQMLPASPPAQVPKEKQPRATVQRDPNAIRYTNQEGCDTKIHDFLHNIKHKIRWKLTFYLWWVRGGGVYVVQDCWYLLCNLLQLEIIWPSKSMTPSWERATAVPAQYRVISLSPEVEKNLVF